MGESKIDLAIGLQDCKKRQNRKMLILAL